MPFTLIHIRPDGTEIPVTGLSTVRKAAQFAGLSLYDNRRATRAEAQVFAARLAKMAVGETLTHGPSGYAACIEKE